MTRRIAWAILWTVWVTLIVAGLTAYLTTRSILLDDLDDSLVRRALALPELNGATKTGAVAPPRGQEGDQYLIQNEIGQTTGGQRLPSLKSDIASRAELIAADFLQTGSGPRVRSIIVRALTRPAPGVEARWVTVTYNGSAEQFDHLLDELTVALVSLVIAGGVAAALVALLVSRSTLRPLYQTAETIGAIDEARLDRRIQSDQLPPELAPVALRMNEMLERLQKANERRRQFLADTSHELRTPVAALMTTLEVALRYPRDAEQYRVALQSCVADAAHLRRLISRLLEQVRAENLSGDQPAEDVDVSDLLGQCADIADALAAGPGITITRAVEPGLRLLTQPDRLRSAVTNVLANAVEYNRPGGAVEFSAQTNGGGLHILIRDTGPGMTPEDLQRLFQPFTRLNRGRRGSSDHLGLGLVLVKTHMQALGGKCRIESQLGVGTTVNLEIPPPE
jgi:signal transduction histidine kinase